MDEASLDREGPGDMEGASQDAGPRESAGPGEAAAPGDTGNEPEWPLEDPVGDRVQVGPGAAPTEVGPGGDGEASASARRAGICPYVSVPGLGWRSIQPTREHRCMAVRPAAALTLEKQRRLCLTETHTICPFFEQALDRRTTTLAGAGLSDAAITSRRSRPYARTAPLVIDPGPAWRRREPAPPGLRKAGQLGLGVLFIVAVTAFVFARMLGGSTPGASPQASLAAIGGATANAAPTPFVAGSALATSAPGGSASAPTPAVRPPPTVRPSAAATPSGSGAIGRPSAVPSLQPAPTASPQAGPPTAPGTYTVRSGDTLSSIAIRFRTTVQAIVVANGIKNPSLIHAGQVLTIP